MSILLLAVENTPAPKHPDEDSNGHHLDIDN